MLSKHTEQCIHMILVGGHKYKEKQERVDHNCVHHYYHHTYTQAASLVAGVFMAHRSSSINRSVAGV